MTLDTHRHLGVGPLRRTADRAFRRWIRRGDVIRDRRRAANIAAGLDPAAPGRRPWDQEPEAYLVDEAIRLVMRLRLEIIDRERAIDAAVEETLHRNRRLGIAAGQVAIPW